MFHPPVKCRTYLDDLSGIQTEEVHIARIIVIVIVVLVIFFLFMVILIIIRNNYLLGFYLQKNG